MQGTSNNPTKNSGHTPWLSVVMPIYNAERWLQESIHSVLKQSFPDYELLLVNDGSTDRSPEICQSFADSDQRVRYISKENGGPLTARLTGLEHALGEYVTFLDADDYYHNSNAFQILREYSLKQEYDVIQFGHINRYRHLSQKPSGTRRIQRIEQEQFIQNEYPKLLCGRWEGSGLTLYLWDKIYNRRLIVSLPASAEACQVFMGDDQIINLHLLENCRSILYVPDRLYTYRAACGGTSRFSTRLMKDLDIVKQYQLQFFQQWQGGENRDRVMHIIMAEVAGWFFGYVQEAVEHLPEPELLALIEEILQYPRFQIARQYYLDHPETTWEAVELLKNQDPKEYLAHAIARHNEGRNLKTKVLQLMKKVYKSI